MQQANRAKGVDSARRVLQILLSFNESSPTITVEWISDRFSISVPSAYRYVSLLRELHLIEENGRGAYTLTPQVFRLAEVAETSLDIERIGKPVIDRLVEQTRETVLILRRSGDAALCVASSIPDTMATISFKRGHLMPLHRGAGPKVLLAALTVDKRERYFASLLAAGTHDTAEVALLRQQLGEISQRRLAVSEAEVDEGVYAVASPITVEGRVVASLSIAGLSFRLTAEDRQTLSATVREGAQEISDLLYAGD